MELKYKIGNALEPTEFGNLFILHCCNDFTGIFGAGIALSIAKKWPHVLNENKNWGNYGDKYLDGSWISYPQLRLGEIQIVPIKGEIKKGNFLGVVNMVGQRDVCDFHDIPPIRYEAIRECLWHVRDCIEKWGTKHSINIVACKFGAGLAGGSFDKIEEIIKEVFDETNIEFTVYSLS